LTVFVILGVIVGFSAHLTSAKASNATGRLSLPWASGTSWLFNGPHTWGGNGLGPWNSLDLEGTDRGHDTVRAATPGKAHLDGWAVSCGYVRVDEGNGWQTTYIHMTRTLVGEGADIHRGDPLGVTDKNVSCFGSASAYHTHFSIWFVPSGSTFCFGCTQYGVDWQGLHGGQGGWQEQIGSYVWTDGAQEYQGCAVQVVTGARTCFQSLLGQSIYNDGKTPGPIALDDLFLYDSGGGVTYVKLGNGTGGWTSTPGPSFQAGWSVYPGQYNSDGLTDLFLYNASNGQSYVELANGSGGWSSAPGPQFSSGWSVYVGDYTGNGLTDLFLYMESTGQSAVELANGSGGWNSVGGPTFSTGWSFFVGLYNNDVYADLFLYAFSSGLSGVELANGTGGWSYHSGPQFSTGQSVSIGNFNSDVYTDLLFYVYSTGATTIEFSNGNAGWTSHAGNSFGAGWGLYPGDFNGDALTDIFLYDYQGSSAYVKFADGTGNWQSGGAQPFATNWSIYPMSLDRNASNDLFLYNFFTGATLVELANGSGGWTPASNPPTFSVGTGIYPGAFDSQ